MHMHMYHLLFGYEEIDICVRHLSCFFNLCRTEKLVYQPLCSIDGVGLRIRCSRSIAARLHPACRRRGIGLKTVRCGGLPVLLMRYRHRIGLALGLLLAVLIVRSGCGVLWQVRVEGNSSLPTAQILEQLSACGLRVGVSLDRDELDTREIENRMLRTTPELAWISVNIRGTVASVQVRELQSGHSAMGQEIVNLVADCDGIVESVRLLTGEVVVQAGQQVRKGELLISGVRDSTAQGFAVEGARGEVMARTTHTAVIQIPLEIEQKVYTGEEFCEKSLIFFEKSIKFSKKTGIMGVSCDTIYTMDTWTLPHGKELPLGVLTLRHRPYTVTLETRSEQQAYELALAQLQEVLRRDAKDALLLNKTVKCSYTQTHCVLVCEYSCLQNIAVPVPLEYAGG